MIRRGALVALGLVALVSVAAPAHAATGRITEITSSAGTLRVVFAASDVPAGASIDPTSVKVTADGVALDATAAPVTAATKVDRTAMLVIDTSGSMRGDRITSAKQAAKDFLGAVPADVRVGLVAFADTARLLRSPTTDRRAVSSAIDGLQAAGETALYDGIVLAVRNVGTEGVRSLLVLSDGGDTASKTRLADLLRGARRNGANIDVVAYVSTESTPVLSQIARATDGRSLSAARVSDVGAAFRQVAEAITNQVVVTASVPAELAGKQVSVRVTASVAGVAISDESEHTLSTVEASESAAPGARAVDVSESFFDSDGTKWLALLALFAGMALLLAVGLGSFVRDAPSGRVRRRLSLYTLTGRVTPERQESTVLGESAVARSAVEFAGKMVERRDLETALALELERAGVPLRPAEWLIIHAGVTVVTALLLLLLSGARLLPTLAGMLIGLTLPFTYLKLKASRRTGAFMAQLPDTLQLLAGSLSAGYSFPQAVDAVVREGAQPMSTEFGRAIIESRLGVPIEDALDHVAERMGSRDFTWVVMAVRIQREVGGNLAEVLTNVSNTMRERERVRRQVKVLSAEGRLSALILGGLPPMFALYLVLVRPTYIKPLYEDPIGILMLCVMGFLFLVGVFWLRKVVKVEV